MWFFTHIRHCYFLALGMTLYKNSSVSDLTMKDIGTKPQQNKTKY